MNKNVFIILLLLVAFHNVNAQNFLKKCWTKQIRDFKNQSIAFSFYEERAELDHSFNPWEISNYKGNGKIFLSPGKFTKLDTLRNGKFKYLSKTQFDDTVLVYQDYGKRYPISISDTENSKGLRTLSYSPAYWINLMYNKNTSVEMEDANYAVYSFKNDKILLKLYVDKKDYLTKKITLLEDDELYGDVESVYEYGTYENYKNIFMPHKVAIRKLNNKLGGIVNNLNFSMVDTVLKISGKTELINTQSANKSNINIEKYSDNISFIELKYNNSRTLVVEFDKFVVVAEAPLNSENGENIINEVKKKYHNKPIKYFVFGHHHPDYIGGVRAFVHNETTILTTFDNINYLKTLITNQHKIRPDSLQIQPKQLKTQIIIDSLVVTDGSMVMTIFHIGKKSDHTNDYLIYYFPKEKVVFEDDLAYIASTGTIKKAGSRQLGLYNSINDLKLDVQNIIQSWPINSGGVKNIFSFDDLKKSAQ